MNQSEWLRLASYAWLMEVFHVSPKHEFVKFYLALFNEIYNLFYILWNEINIGIYEWD